jgi:heme-degrading monooxygenase HmoA
MLLAIVRVPAPPTPEAAAEMERRFAERLPMVRQSPGFQGVELLRPADGEGPYLSISRWASRADFETWRTSTYNAAAHGRPPGTEGQPPPAHGAHGRPPGSESQAQRGGAELYELVEM